MKRLYNLVDTLYAVIHRDLKDWISFLMFEESLRALVAGFLARLSSWPTIHRELNVKRPPLSDPERSAGFRLPFRPLAGLAQDEEPDCTTGQARSGRGLGQMTRTHSLPCERWGENRPPKGKGGPRLGSVDKGWCCHERELNDSESS
jgi:hypothetical protein